jgi:hypothetical protein
MVAVGGFSTVNGNIMPFGDLEHVLMQLRAHGLDTQEIKTRAAYRSVPRNYGNVDLEMTAEMPRTINTSHGNNIAYNMPVGTPLFIETMRGDSDRYVALVSASPAANQIQIDRVQSPMESQLHVGEEIEINGEQRTITAIGVAGNTLTVTVVPAFTNLVGGVVPLGSTIVIKGHDYANPHLSPVHRLTDKYGSNIIDDNRYQIDRVSGRIRYRPSFGTLANSVWHPETQLNKPYYFGREMSIRRTPPPAGPGVITLPLPAAQTDVLDSVTGNEVLGHPDDPVSSGSNAAIALPGVTTNFGRAYPDGEFSNISISAPAGVTFEVELNGAKLAVFSDPTTPGGGNVIIPFFDPDFNNDQLKGSRNVDPDIYIQRFLKEGNNNLVIKATSTTAGSNGIRVEGTFNGIDLETGAVAGTKPHSATSVIASDWSASQHSILGVAGFVNFELGDRIALEDVNDEVQKMQGVLESLSTLIAGIDINQLTSLLSVIK